MNEVKMKRLYAKPQVTTSATERPAVLLICTGQYNCIDEAGYDCCQSSPSDCGNC